MTESPIGRLWDRRRVRILIYALALLILAIPFARPFLLGQHPASGDGLINLYRVVALDDAIQHGDLWPRFLSSMHYGYGGPNFNFYSPLALYVIEIIHLLGASLPLAYRLGIICFGIFAATGMFLLGRRWAGNTAGLVAAAAMLYAPQVFSTFDRPAQLLAVSMLPWLVWALERTVESQHARDMALLGILVTAVILTHNVTALYALPTITLYGIYLIWEAEDHVTAGLIVAAPIAAGVWLATFFWLPALAEQQYVQLHRLDIPQFDYHNYFLTVTQIFPLELPRAISLGWPQIVLAVVAGIIGLKAVLRSRIVFSVAMILVLAFFTTRASVLLWDHAPLVRLILFPQRLLFGAAMWLALLAGCGAAWLLARSDRLMWRVGGMIAILAILIVYALPTLTTAYLDEPPSADSIRDLHKFERDTGWVGASSAGEFLPVWVEDSPDVWALAGRFSEADVIPRLQENDEVQVFDATWEPKRVVMRIDAAADTNLILEWFFFPGWTGSIDGVPIIVGPTAGDGLISVPVPGGVHDVEVAFRATPVRRLAQGISIAGLIVFGVGLVWWHDRGRKKTSTAVT